MFREPGSLQRMWPFGMKMGYNGFHTNANIGDSTSNFIHTAVEY